MTRHSGLNELWIDADWLLGRRTAPRSTHRRSWGLLAAAVMLFCIGPAMQAAKKPARREGDKAALQKSSSAPLVGPNRHAHGSGIPGNQMESAKAFATTTTADTDSFPQVTFADSPTERERSTTPEFFLPTAQEFVALPFDASSNFCVEASDALLSIGPSEPTWSPTAFWYTTCQASWGDSPWGLRPDAWVIPAVSMSEGMQ